MPKSDWWGAASRSKASLDRRAQRRDSSRLPRDAPASIGKGGHSSSCIWMSERRRHWISTERSGVSMWRLPSTWLRNSTPSSVSFRCWARLITW